MVLRTSTHIRIIKAVRTRVDGLMASILNTQTVSKPPKNPRAKCTEWSVRTVLKVGSSVGSVHTLELILNTLGESPQLGLSDIYVWKLLLVI